MRLLKECSINDLKNGSYEIHCKDNQGDSVFVATVGNMNSRRLNKSYAKLIAAAPDMLDALQDALEVIYDNPLLEDRIQAVIDEATGGK